MLVEGLIKDMMTCDSIMIKIIELVDRSVL
jgi:hypothetical protein